MEFYLIFKSLVFIPIYFLSFICGIALGKFIVDFWLDKGAK